MGRNPLNVNPGRILPQFGRKWWIIENLEYDFSWGWDVVDVSGRRYMIHPFVYFQQTQCNPVSLKKGQFRYEP